MTTSRLIVIDSAVAVPQDLLSQLPEGSVVLSLKAGANSLAQIAETVAALAAEGRAVETLDLISHGGEGFIVLDGVRYDKAEIESHADVLAVLGSQLAPGADWLLYGCNVAEGGDGHAFIDALAKLVGGDVAASTNLTGAAALGGDSVLEAWAGTGSLDAAALDLSDWPELLAAPITETFDEVAVDGDGNSLGDSNQPRQFGNWTITWLGTIDYNSYVDVTSVNGASGGSYLVNSGSDKVAHIVSGFNNATAVVLKSTGGEEFAFQSLWVEKGGSDAGGYRIAGYLNGFAVPGASQDFTIPDLGSTVQVTVSGTSWQYVDELRIVKQSGAPDVDIFIDDIVVGPAVLPNAAPVVAGLNGDSLTFIEDGTPLLIDAGSDATITDNDSPNFSTGTLTASITANRVGSEDVLGILNQGTAAGQIGVAGSNVTFSGTLIGTFTGGSGTNDLVVTFNASSSPAAATALVHALTYTNTNHAQPSTSTRMVAVTVSDGAGGTSNVSNVAVSVSGVNDAPTAAATGLNSTYTENGSAALLFNNAVISAVEAGQNIRELKFTVSNLADAGHEFLRLDGTNIALANNASGTTGTNAFSYSVSVSSTTASVTLTKAGGVSASTVQTLLGSVGYLNTSDSPTTTASHVVTLTSISDTGGTANGGVDTAIVSIASTVTVVAVNDAPTLSAGSYALPSTDEDTSSTATSVATLLSQLGYADPDGAGLPSGIAISGAAGHGAWQYSADDGAHWTNVGVVSQNEALLLSSTSLVRYQPDLQNGETATLTVRAWDQTEAPSSTNSTRITANIDLNGGTTQYSSTTAQVSVAVDSRNDAPTNIFLSGNTVAENSGSGALRSVSTLTTADVDTGDSFTYSFAGGADDSLFQIVGNELRFQDTTTLDFEAKSSYSITLKTTDAGGLTFDKTVSVLLTDVNEVPVVAVPLVAQSAAAGLSYSYTVPAGSFTDPDSGQTDTLSYSATLADGSGLPWWLSFDSATRTFSGTPTSGDVGTPSVRVTASDGGGLSAYSDFMLSVVNGPSVNSIVRAGSAAELTNAASLTFTITFSESVIGVTNDDFIITGTGTGGSVGTPSSSDGGVTWTVQVTGAGEGTLRLDLKSSGTGIQSANNSAAIISGYTGGQSYSVDRTAPPTPTINTATLTNQALPTLSGTAETNATVTVVVGGATYTTTATGGAWSINLASANPHAGVLALNANGSNLVSVIATDAAGNPSASPATQTLVIDTTPPAAPAVTSPALTNQELPTLAGTGEVGATITVVVGMGHATYTTVANGSGAWSVNLATAVPTSGTLVLNSDGTNSVTVTARDAANNPSPVTPHTLTIDTTPPAQTFSLPQFSNDKGSSDTDFITNTPAQVISATLSTGLGNGDVVWGSLDDGATWTDITAKVSDTTLTWNDATLTGSGTLKLKVTDAAGNDGSVLSQVYVLDTVAPAIEAGTVSLDGDSGSSTTDFITNSGSNQTLRGTLSGNLSADEIVEVSLDNGTTWTTATALPSTNSWSLSGVTLAASGTLQVRVSDTAGNSSTALSQAYTVDTAAPVFDPATSSPGDNATGVGISSALVLRFGEPLGAVDTAKVYLRDVATQTLVAAAVTLNADGALVITPNARLASLTDYYVSWDADALKDVAGNAVEVVDNATTFNFKTELVTPPTPVDPAPPTGPVVVDGVAVTTVTQADGSTRISIPIVPNDRQESVGAGSTADITLVKAANGQPILSVGVPTGVGVTAEGFATSQSASAALADLGLRLERVDGASNQLINDGNRFFASLDPAAKLVVQVLTLSIPGTTAPGEPIRVTGTTASNVLEAVVIDARGLPAGTVLQVDDIDFVAIVGAVRVIGGAGRNSASGDGAAQYIVLGADDDIIHGGAGNDTVGSKGGDDQIYGDAGDDIVFGGAGNDLLSGGSGSDKLNGGTGFDVALQEGKRSDYSITLDGTGIKLTHIATSVADWLVDVEQVRFETGPILTVAHSAAEEAAAFLFQQWMGRDLTQAEGAVIQTLDGLSALQVADLFAQVFPQQAGGKTAQQLLEGMEAAGAIRVDVARETTFVGDAGNNTFTPPMGLAWTVDGGAGIDTIVIPATLAQMHVEASATGHTLQRMTDGAMLELVNVERVTLSDTQLALDLDGHAGEAAKLIGAVAGAAFLDNKPLVGEVIRALDAGISAQSLAQLGLQLLGANTPGQVTQLLWTNVVGSAPTPAQLQPFIDMMAQGVTGGELAVLAGNLELNAVRIDLVGLAATGIEFA